MSPFLSYLLKAQFSSSFMGGNSTKATSGINGAGTNAQKELNIPDSAKIFFEDTKKSVRSASLDSPRPCAHEYFRLVTSLAMTSLKSLLAALVMPSTGFKVNSVSIFQRSPVSVATASPVPIVVMPNSLEWCVFPRAPVLRPSHSHYRMSRLSPTLKWSVSRILPSAILNACRS